MTNWAIAAVLLAEGYGVTQANVDEMAAAPPSPTIGPLLGSTLGIGKRLGPRESRAKEMIAEVGYFAKNP